MLNATRTHSSYIGVLTMKLAILALFVFAGYASAADDAESKKLLKDLEGSYTVTAAELSGGSPPPGFLPSIEKLTIKDNKFSITFKFEGKLEEKSATITVDATKKPAQIDLKPLDGDKKDQTVMGIVAIEKDGINVCWTNAPDGKRPADFKTSKNDKNMSLTLKKMAE